MTDTIFITGIVIHARHGVMEHETEVGQRFVIDLELYTDLSESSRTDRLSDTVSYSNVVATATSAFKNTNYKLLERAAGAVALFTAEGAVLLDPGSLQDSLLNLILNARDAISGTGVGSGSTLRLPNSRRSPSASKNRVPSSLPVARPCVRNQAEPKAPSSGLPV